MQDHPLSLRIVHFSKILKSMSSYNTSFYLVPFPMSITLFTRKSILESLSLMEKLLHCKIISGPNLLLARYVFPPTPHPLPKLLVVCRSHRPYPFGPVYYYSSTKQKHGRFIVIRFICFSETRVLCKPHPSIHVYTSFNVLPLTYFFFPNNPSLTVPSW